jgi:DNA-binding beta-propeller fold protein YncE
VNTEVKKLFVAVVIAGASTVLAPVGAVNLGYDTPRGMAFDPAGNLFVANPDAGNIVKFTPDGHSSTFASGLVHPFGLAFDGGANLFVADAQSDGKSGLIVKFSRDEHTHLAWPSTAQAISSWWICTGAMTRADQS